MKPRFYILRTIFLFFLLSFFSFKAHSQVFQNSNTACESTAILCSSATGAFSGFCADQAEDISCKNTYGRATDLNNDNYPDCVLFNGFNDLSTSFPSLSTLMNAAASQSACGTSPGVFNETADYFVVGFPSVAVENTNSTIQTAKFASSDLGDSILLQRDSSFIGLILGGFDPNSDEATTLIELTTTFTSNYNYGEGHPSMAVSDCNNSGYITDIYQPMVYQPSNNKLILNALRYGAYNSDINTSIVVSTQAKVSTAVADFDGNGQNDVAMAVNDAAADGGIGSQLIICLSTGDCNTTTVNFNCYSISETDGSSNFSGEDPRLNSITAGDFNGDGKQDIAFTVSNLADPNDNGVSVLEGVGDGTFNTPGVHVAGNLNSSAAGVPLVLTKGCYNNDTLQDLAYSYNDGVKGAVGLMISSTDGSGNYNNSTATKLSFVSSAASQLNGISSADFDLQGGDDIIAVSTNGSSSRRADLFMNAVETVSAEAGPTAYLNTGDTLVVSDASCSVSPVDPEMSFNVAWSNYSIPASATAPSYSGSDTLTPSITFNSAGTYILQLDCTADRCGSATSNFLDTAFKIVKVSSPIVCGNGVVESGEACDDGNSVNGDGCSACVLDACGNGVRDTGEQCDDGNTTNGDGCSSACLSESCGDGNIQSSLGETCDDGNTTNGDGCDSTCALEICGNGVVNIGESCDDGNTTNGDGCDSSCKREQCGDNIVDFGETCDDGNTTSGDGCSSTCRSEGAIVCGNGILEAGEGCDDGNTTSGDGCSTRCSVETENPVCGNYIIEQSETCDDGNTNNGDGCNSACTLENNSGAICGNGVRELGETCDDGNRLSGDGCSNVCITEGTSPIFLNSQGGCVASLQPSSPLSASGLAPLLLALSFLWSLRRRLSLRA